MKKLQFPTMLRKMWSGGDVQEWLDAEYMKPKIYIEDTKHIYEPGWYWWLPECDKQHADHAHFWTIIWIHPETETNMDKVGLFYPVEDAPTTEFPIHPPTA